MFPQGVLMFWRFFGPAPCWLPNAPTLGFIAVYYRCMKALSRVIVCLFPLAGPCCWLLFPRSQGGPVGTDTQQSQQNRFVSNIYSSKTVLGKVKINISQLICHSKYVNQYREHHHLTKRFQACTGIGKITLCSFLRRTKIQLHSLTFPSHLHEKKFGCQ